MNYLSYIIDISNSIIKELQQGEGLYIINKNMEARVLFYYKPEVYFLSDIIKLPNKIINKKDDKELEDICSFISDKFDNTDLLRKSLKIENIDIIIKKYFYDSFVISVNRVEKIIKNKISLETYNKILVLKSNDTILEISNNDSKVLYKKSNISFLDSNPEEMLNDILNQVSYYNNYYPTNTVDKEYIELSDDYFNDDSIIIFCNIIAEIPHYCKVIGISKHMPINMNYLLLDLLLLQDEDIELSINNILKNINTLYNSENRIIN